MGNSKSSFKSSRLARLGSVTKTLVTAGSKLAVDYALSKKEQLDEVNYKVKAAKDVVKTMGQMKGALMKLGQMISISEDMLLPKEISALFKELQRQAPPMSDQDVDQIFLKNFGKKPEDIFLKFDRQSIASASIGQVHRAVLKTGEDVAVKIQYPEIVNAIRSDFKNINELYKLLDLLYPKKPNLDEFLDELKHSLERECDYLHEKEELKRFKHILACEFKDITVPKVFEDFSTAEVLTMEYVHGDHFEDVLNYTQEEKNIVGELLYQSFLYSLWGHQTLHTDPQNGNYFFTRNKIILIDFGSTRQFSENFLVDYCALFLAIEEDNFPLYKAASFAVNFFTAADSDEVIKKHFQLVEALYRPYLNPGKYAVTDIEPFKLLKEFTAHIDLKGRESPRREFLLLDRTNLGLFAKLKTLKAEVDWVSGKNRYRAGFDTLARAKYASHFN